MIIKIVLLLSIIMLMIALIWKADIKINKKIILLMLAYIYCIYLFTMSGRVGIFENRVLNLMPGESIFIMLSSPWNNRGGYEFVEAMGNILLFVPLGLFLRKWMKCNYMMIMAVALLFTTGIEYLQYYLMLGTFEIDDVANNIWGCFVGTNLVYISECVRDRKVPEKKLELLAMGALIFFVVFAMLLYLRFILKMGVIIKP